MIPKLDKQSDSQTDRQTFIEPDRHIKEIHTDRQKDAQTGRRTDIRKDKRIERLTDRQTDRQRALQLDR